MITRLRDPQEEGPLSVLSTDSDERALSQLSSVFQGEMGCLITGSI